MRGRLFRVTVIAACIGGSASLAPLRAAEGVLVVQVSDVQGEALPRVQLATKGDGAVGPPTDEAGRTRIALASQTRPLAIVALTIVKPADFVFISPWDSQVRVPPFENDSQNFVAIVLAKRGERAMLENGKVVSSIVARVNLSTSAKDGAPSPVRPPEALAQAAALIGLPAGDLQAAMFAWSRRTKDPYEKGMVSLYAGNLDDATAKLTEALALRERAPNGPRDAADAAFFLGQVLYRQGKYANAAAAYRRALAHRPGDPATTNNLGLTLVQRGDYASADPLLRLAVSNIETASGAGDPDIVFPLNNLGTMLVVKGDYEHAEALFRRGLEIRRTALGARDILTAHSMTNLASVLLARGKDEQAEPLLTAALDIFDLAPAQGPQAAAPKAAAPQPTAPQAAAPPVAAPPVVAPPAPDRAAVAGGTVGAPGRSAVRLNQAILARHRRAFAESKKIAEEVVAARTETAGPRSQETGNALVVLGQTELASGDALAALRSFARAIDILGSLLGGQHPVLAEPLAAIGDAAVQLKDTTSAASSYRRASVIRRVAFGSDDPIAASITKKLNALLQQ